MIANTLTELQYLSLKDNTVIEENSITIDTPQKIQIKYTFKNDNLKYTVFETIEYGIKKIISTKVLLNDEKINFYTAEMI